MAEKNPTIFQRMNRALFGSGMSPEVMSPSSSNIPQDTVLYSTNNEQEYIQKLNQLKQQKLLSYQWVKAENDSAVNNLNNYTPIRLMYRDADLMDGMPEIGKAMDIISDEACCFNSDGEMLHVYSKSNRIKSILDDLFVNRLNVHVMLPMICRSMLKYGNTFMLLNIDKDNGVLDWKQLPVYEIDRIEAGYSTYGSGELPQTTNEVTPGETRFAWIGHNESMPYRNWQVAHFRLLYDSFFLPYGQSMLHKARRAWRMWSMMEDAMLIYRLDKSVERRVYKVYVGAIDDADVPAFVNEVANKFKRTPIIDPLTGQVDLRTNFLSQNSDYFIPVRSENAANPIDTLQSAQNATSMEDIEYMQNKVFAALGVPKTFLNFQEAQGKGQNLSLMDIRMARMVNRIQQFILMELNKIALIHLYLMGLGDEMGNFTLSMNSPSNQIESLELDDWAKRLNLVSVALTDPGTGYPLMSFHQALKRFMKMSDSEIKDMLNEIRLEKAMAAELEGTANIIKKTGIFDTVDNIYGDYEAMNSPQPAPQQNDEMGGGAMGGGGGMPSLGGDLGGMEDMGEDLEGLGEPGGENGPDVNGGDLETSMQEAPAADNGTLQEIRVRRRPVSETKKKRAHSFMAEYFRILSGDEINEKKEQKEIDDIEKMNESINERIKRGMESIDSFTDKD